MVCSKSTRTNWSFRGNARTNSWHSGKRGSYGTGDAPAYIILGARESCYAASQSHAGYLMRSQRETWEIRIADIVNTPVKARVCESRMRAWRNAWARRLISRDVKTGTLMDTSITEDISLPRFTVHTSLPPLVRSDVRHRRAKDTNSTIVIYCFTNPYPSDYHRFDIAILLQKYRRLNSSSSCQEMC